MFHYVYVLRLGPLFYVGCRSSQAVPEEDSSYMGSGAWFSGRSKRGVQKEILSEWPCRWSAEAEETRLIRQFIREPLCLNRRVTQPKRRKTHV